MSKVTTVGGVESFLIGKHYPDGQVDQDARLRNCPFCGHPAGFRRDPREYDKFQWRAECTNTSCQVATPFHYQSPEAAMEAWNRREPGLACKDYGGSGGSGNESAVVSLGPGTTFSLKIGGPASGNGGSTWMRGSGPYANGGSGSPGERGWYCATCNQSFPNVDRCPKCSGEKP